MRGREKAMSDTETKEVPQLKNQTPFQRFQRILGRGLAIGLESNVSEKDTKINRIKNQLGNEFNVKAENAIRLPTDESATHQLINQPQTVTMHIRHSATTNEADLLRQLILYQNFSETVLISFKALPVEVMPLFHRLNIRQRVDDKVLGLAFARFPTEVSKEDSVFYAIKDCGATDGYLNLDCLSRSAVWNPLFVKYHLAVMPSLKANEFGYVKVDVNRDDNRSIVVTVSRVQESEVPDILKTTKTLPR